MDHYDDTQHPSHSIPNAAYPDSPYRPGEGQQQNSSLSSLHNSHGMSNTPGGSSPSLGFAPYAAPPPAHHQAGQWPSDAVTNGHPAGLRIPQSPPPPYDPGQTPSPYSPLDTSSSHRPPPSPLHDGSIPLQTMTPVATPSQYQPGPPYPGQHPQRPQHHQQHSNLQVPTSPNPLHGSGASTLSAAGKLDPQTAARLRKRRRMKICIFVAGAVVVFMAALLIGVGLGVVKQALHNNDDDNNDDGGDPRHG